MDSEVRSKSEQEAMDQEFSSEDLMARTAGGDESAFETLVNRHQTSVLNLIYRFVGDRAKAQDLAQEVFLRVWQAARSYKHEAKFTTWIYRITANLCFNELTGHIPLVIWMDDYAKFQVDGKEITFAGFPTGKGPYSFQGKWTMEDLRKALDQMTTKK